MSRRPAVVQHHDQITDAVRNLLSAWARMYAKQFMVIDGQTTALILAAHCKLPAAGAADRRS